MTKSRDRPIAGASRRSRRAQSAWKVEIHTPAASVAQQRLDALAHLLGGLVGEGDGEHFAGCAWPSPTRYAMRWAMTRVLPEPGAGEDQQRPVGVQDRLALLGVQAVEN